MLVLLLVACEGGMVGTGTGPEGLAEAAAYQSQSLPGRIGTNLPAPLIDPQILATLFKHSSMEDAGAGDQISEQWLTLVEQIGDIESLRLKSEESLLLIDAVLPAVRSQCEQSGEQMGEQTGEGICRLPARRIEGHYTEALVAGIDAVYTRALGTAGETSAALDSIRTELRSRLGTTYRLGDVELVPGDGQPYEIDLTTSLSEVLGNNRLRIRSDASRTRSELTISRQVGDILDRQYMGFATGLPGERFTYTRDRSIGDGIEHRFDVSIVADDSPDRRVLLDARYRRRVGDIDSDLAFQVQVDNRQGFASSREYRAVGESIRNIEVTQESFTADGALLAGRTCKDRVAPQACTNLTDFTLYGAEGQQVSDNPLYFIAAEFGQLTAMNDAVQFEVVGLPMDVVEFQVLSDTDNLPLIDRDVLCTGVQLAAGDVLLYCTAPDIRLSTSKVVAIDRDTGAMTRVPGASVVPL